MSRASEALPSPWVGADGHLPLPWLETGLSAALSQRGHALLVHGPEGVGQFELAMVLAQSVLCEAPVPARAPTGVPCGHCEACHLLQAGAHPDLMVLVPEALRESLGLSLASADGEGGEGGAATGAVTKSKTAGREIRVADVRRAIDWGHQTSSRGRGKVLVLHPAQALNLVAANALLKTLEEPAGALRLILSTADPQALLPTLRSRCQQVNWQCPRLKFRRGGLKRAVWTMHEPCWRPPAGDRKRHWQWCARAWMREDGPNCPMRFARGVPTCSMA